MTADKPHRGSCAARGARRSGRAPRLLPVLPLRDIVVFPHMIVPLFVGREKSVRALEEVMKDDKQILLVAQKNAAAGRSRRPMTSTASAPSRRSCNC